MAKKEGLVIVRLTIQQAENLSEVIQEATSTQQKFEALFPAPYDRDIANHALGKLNRAIFEAKNK